jgi:endoglucanase
MNTIKEWSQLNRRIILLGLALLLGLGVAVAVWELSSGWDRWRSAGPGGTPFGAPPTPAGPPTLHLGSAPLSAGEITEIPVMVRNVPAPGLVGFDLEIGFAPGVIRVHEVLPGDHPWTNNASVISNQRGQVLLANSQSPASSGDFLLARLKVEVISQDRQSGAFRLETAIFRNASGARLPVVLAEGDIPILAPQAEDPIPSPENGDREMPLPDPGSDVPQAPSSDPHWLRVEGNRIVNQWGETVVFRGVNIENREWVWHTEQSISFDIRAAAEATAAPPAGWGANIIVLAVASGPINRNDITYLEHLDQMVDEARSNNAYTILLYRYPEPNHNQPSMPDQAAEEAMATLAARYSNDPWVLYGLQAEPHDVTWSQLKPRFTSMIDAIRLNNPQALIVVPGTQWSRFVHWALNDPIPRPGLIYKVHYYDSFDVAESSYHLSEMAAQYPLLLGEFGSGSRMGLEDVQQLLDLAEERGISWAAWLFHDRACPCMLSNAEDFSPSPFGEEIRRRLQTEASPRPVFRRDRRT